MFYFLLILGSLSILSGFLLVRKTSNLKEEPGEVSYKEIEEIHILNKRIDELERVFLQEDDLEKEDELELIRKYEEEGYSVEEIAKFLDRSLGEVLLLKKLEKNY